MKDVVRVSEVRPDKEAFNKLGFEINSVADKISEVKIPNGWKIEKQSENFFILKDHKGRKRGHVLEGDKGNICLKPFYELKIEPVCRHNTIFRVVKVVDWRGREIYNSGAQRIDQLSRIEAENYVSMNYPLWRDVLAYWDD